MGQSALVPFDTEHRLNNCNMLLHSNNTSICVDNDCAIFGVSSVFISKARIYTPPRHSTHSTQYVCRTTPWMGGWEGQRPTQEVSPTMKESTRLLLKAIELNLRRRNERHFIHFSIFANQLHPNIYPHKDQTQVAKLHVLVSLILQAGSNVELISSDPETCSNVQRYARRDVEFYNKVKRNEERSFVRDERIMLVMLTCR
jgi:hypothetical protein